MPAPPRAPQPVQWTSQLPNTPQSVCGCTSLANIRAVPHTQHREPFVEGSPPTALGRTVERLVPRLGRSANPSSACVLLVCTESSAAAHLQTRSTSSSSSFPQSSSCYSPPSASIQSVRSLTAYSSHSHIEPKQIRLRTGTFADEARRLNDQHHPRHDQLDP